MITIQNQYLKATINPKGAELVSLIQLSSNIDFMWEGDATFWGKHSPVLFPIVGSLKDNTYFYEGKSYQLGRHGFARDREFLLETHTEDSVTFLLVSDENTKTVYPFDFEFRLKYTLQENQLELQYIVDNSGDKLLWFSVGGHPAFKVPIEEGLAYDDYRLVFNQTEDFARWPLSPEGLIMDEPESTVITSNEIVLTKELFQQDALVYKNLQSDSITLKSHSGQHQLEFGFKGYPFLGIWAAKNANFVCIEPWCGIADHVSHNQDITQKEGMIALNPSETFTRAWSVKLV